ncbi:MAG: FHA domain-containing protein [Eubacteriales bacterium]|nr:FHA domain-containing protein [Eubacteriales bacterium]
MPHLANDKASWVWQRPISDEELLQNHLVDFLTRHAPDWAVELAITITEKQQKLLYLAPGYSSLDSLQINDLNAKKGYHVLGKICEAVIAADDHLVEFEQIMLTPDLIFISPIDDHVALIIVPLCGLTRDHHTNEIETGIGPGIGIGIETETRSGSGSGFGISLPNTALVNNCLVNNSLTAQVVLINLLDSMAKAFHWTPEAMATLRHLIDSTAGDGHACVKAILDHVQAYQDVPHVNNLNQEAISQTIPIHAKPPTTGTRLTIWQLLKRMAIPLLIIAHLALGIMSYLSIASITTVGRAFPPGLLFGIAFGLLLIDLWMFRPWHELKPLLTRLIKQKKLGQKPVKPPVSRAAQTVLLPPQQGLLRLGLLSEKLPGSPEEMDGLRAFILVAEFVVGRDATQCDLALNDESIGRKHARIIRREGTFFVHDLGSKNGTYLDGRRLNKFEDYLLPDRCRVEFAGQAFFFAAD